MKIKVLVLFFVFFFIGCKSSKKSQSVSTENKNEKIIQSAKKHIGTSYKSGGKSPETGFDCSGFTAYIFKKINISLAATASQQSNQGKAVFVKEAQKGDLIFFKGGNANDTKIGHVGIVVSNEGEPIKFIHASSSKGIMISQLDEKYFRDRFVKIRRVIF
ncbi:MAG: NlpC/P60 family protein [Bacteroidetes bacterium]|nr:MAG: NlpC/P60 family protein [Bacteroidota bacterium]